MSYSAYPMLKETAVPWIGPLPEHWQVMKLHQVVRMRSGSAITSLEMDEANEYPVYGGNGHRGYYSSFNQEGTFVLIGRQGAECGNINYAEGKFWASEHAVVATPDRPLNHRWLGETLRAMNLNQYSQSAAQPGLSVEVIGRLKLPFPPVEEQQQIAAFLDWKTSQIDALIAKKQTLLQKLKEKRLAVITQAVTKGLNPDVPMRDSGIAWLGEVPSHWEVKPVKFLTRIVRGQFSHRPRNDPAFYDGEYPFVQTGDIARAGKFVTSYSQTLNERGLSVSRQFPAGTLVMTIAANIGDMAIIDFAACFPDSIVGFIPEEKIDLDFLYFMFIAMKQRLMMTAVLNTQLNLNIDRIASIETVAPPHDEQIRIVELLDAEVKRSDMLMEKAEEAITRLTEYRSALITAATTGKIDVRNVAIPAHA